MIGKLIVQLWSMLGIQTLVWIVLRKDMKAQIQFALSTGGKILILGKTFAVKTQ